MWSEYFGSSATITGIDITEKNLQLPDNVNFLKANQSDVGFLRNVLCQSQIDIVIDDASHRPEDIILTFETLWPCLAPNGYYAIEVCFYISKKQSNLYNSFLKSSESFITKSVKIFCKLKEGKKQNNFVQFVVVV